MTLERFGDKYRVVRVELAHPRAVLKEILTLRKIFVDTICIDSLESFCFLYFSASGRRAQLLLAPGSFASSEGGQAVEHLFVVYRTHSTQKHLWTQQNGDS